jgi:hypothetical protein
MGMDAAGEYAQQSQDANRQDVAGDNRAATAMHDSASSGLASLAMIEVFR